MPRVTVRSLWIGPELSVMEQLSIRSYLCHGHAFELYAYEEIKGVPPDVVLLDANAILPHADVPKYKYVGSDSPAAFADVFRYTLLSLKGGIWSDLDMVCLRPITLCSDYLFVCESTHGGGRLKDRLLRIPAAASRLIPGWLLRRYFQMNNCFIRTPPGAAVMAYCRMACKETEGSAVAWGTTAPLLLTRACNQFGLWSSACHPNLFQPVNWWEITHFTNPRYTMDILSGAFGVHLYHERWKANGIDKHATHPRDCIYEQLKRQYL